MKKGLDAFIRNRVSMSENQDRCLNTHLDQLNNKQETKHSISFYYYQRAILESSSLFL